MQHSCFNDNKSIANAINVLQIHKISYEIAYRNITIDYIKNLFKITINSTKI